MPTDIKKLSAEELTQLRNELAQLTPTECREFAVRLLDLIESKFTKRKPGPQVERRKTKAEIMRDYRKKKREQAAV